MEDKIEDENYDAGDALSHAVTCLYAGAYPDGARWNGTGFRQDFKAGRRNFEA